MSDTETVFLVGAILFFVSAFILTLTYGRYVWRGQKLIEKYKCMECVSWTATRWIYPVFILSASLMGILYLSMYFHQGFASKPNNLLVMWERWVILAIVGFLASRCLTYIMTIHSDDEQSFSLNFLYTFAYAVLLGATLSQAHQTRTLWAVVSIVFFVCAVALYVFPVNKFNCYYHTPSPLQYHKPLYAFIIFYYVYNMIIYFVSQSNEYVSPGSGLSFQGEATAYLVGDAIFMVGFPLLLIIASFFNLKDTIRMKDKTTGAITYASSTTGRTIFGAKKKNNLDGLA